MSVRDVTGQFLASVLDSLDGLERRRISEPLHYILLQKHASAKHSSMVLRNESMPSDSGVAFRESAFRFSTWNLHGPVFSGLHLRSESFSQKTIASATWCVSRAI